MAIRADFLFNEPFLITDWLEAVALFSPNQLTIAPRKSYTTLNAYVTDFDKLKNCLRYLLGTSIVINEQISRRLPARHPIWTSMRCKEVLDVKGVQFDGKEVKVPLNTVPFAKYEKFRVEAAFTQYPYAHLEDDRVDEDGGEFLRYTTIKPKPYLENIVMEGGMFVFDAAGKNWNGRPLASMRPLTRQEKSAIAVTVHQVPLEQIASSDGGTYPRFDAAIGRLNLTEFLGKPPGTMLLDDVDVDIYADPLETDLQGTVYRHADVTFTFKHFDPPQGYDDPDDEFRGWNNFPAYDGLFYWVKNPDTDEPPFRYAEMNDLLNSAG